jgi:hypothetical protein
MLKFTYTENGFSLEHLTQSLEDWVTTRVVLALRSGTPICVEPSTAGFLLPMNLAYLGELQKLAQGENPEILELTPCDGEYLEVSLQGTWMATDAQTQQGCFVCLLSDRTEFLLHKLWEEAQLTASVVND